MAEEKFRRRIRAEAALGSLSAGPPLAVAKSDEDRVSCTFAYHPSNSVQEERLYNGWVLIGHSKSCSSEYKNSAIYLFWLLSLGIGRHSEH